MKNLHVISPAFEEWVVEVTAGLMYHHAGILVRWNNHLKSIQYCTDFMTGNEHRLALYEVPESWIWNILHGGSDPNGSYAKVGQRKMQETPASRDKAIQMLQKHSAVVTLE